MKKIIKKIISSLILIILIILIAWLLKDTTIQDSNAQYYGRRFIKILDEGTFEIYCDTQTRVLYLQSYAGTGYQGYGGLTVLVGKDGKPLLYESEE